MRQERMAGDSIGLLREERNESGYGKPKQSLDKKKHESPKTQFLNIATNFHNLIGLRVRKDTMTIKKDTSQHIGDCRLPIADWSPSE
jgi:hypothetical protein